MKSFLWPMKCKWLDARLHEMAACNKCLHAAPSAEKRTRLHFLTHHLLVPMRDKSQQLLRQPKTLAGTVQQLCIGWGLVLFIGLQAICSALGYPEGIQCMRQIPSICPLLTNWMGIIVFVLGCKQLDAHFCLVEENNEGTQPPPQKNKINCMHYHLQVAQMLKYILSVYSSSHDTLIKFVKESLISLNLKFPATSGLL